jgi:hypothetical protein
LKEIKNQLLCDINDSVSKNLSTNSKKLRYLKRSAKYSKWLFKVPKNKNTKLGRSIRIRVAGCRFINKQIEVLTNLSKGIENETQNNGKRINRLLKSFQRKTKEKIENKIKSLQNKLEKKV